jgi:hypothetical protein
MRKSEIKVLTQAISTIGRINKPTDDKILKNLTLKQLYTYLKYKSFVKDPSKLIGAPILKIDANCVNTKVHKIKESKKKSRFTKFFTNYRYSKKTKFVYICKELDVKNLKYIKHISDMDTYKHYRYIEIDFRSNLDLGEKFTKVTNDTLFYDRKENKLYLSIKDFLVKNNKIEKSENKIYKSLFNKPRYRKFGPEHIRALLYCFKIESDIFSGKRPLQLNN